MKRYTIEIIIEKGQDEFWEELNAENKTGCDGLIMDITVDLESYSPKSVKLIKYEDIK